MMNLPAYKLWCLPKNKPSITSESLFLILRLPFKGAFRKGARGAHITNCAQFFLGMNENTEEIILAFIPIGYRFLYISLTSIKKILSIADMSLFTIYIKDAMRTFAANLVASPAQKTICIRPCFHLFSWILWMQT